MKKKKKTKYPKNCGKGKRGCEKHSIELLQTDMRVIAGRHCKKGCTRRKSWETMIGTSFESRLAA